MDTAADSEGYYQVILGEQLDGGRYQVFAVLGKGMFANVVRARVLQSDDGDVGKEVAIKIIRSQESMWVLVFSLLFNYCLISVFQVQSRAKGNTNAK